MEFMVIFGLLGLLAIPSIVLFVVCGVDKEHKIGGAMVCVIVWFVFSLGMFGQYKMNDTAWNDGRCECGQQWELVAVSKYRSSETKYYTCPECHMEIELNY